MRTAIPQGTPRRAISLFFLAAGIGIGSWAASLPSISGQFDLSNGQLGLVLLCFAGGAIGTMTAIGRVIPRLGTANICVVGASLFGAALVAVPQLPNMFVLAIVVGVAGASFGALDVAMNTEAAFLEQKMRRHIMASFHAIFSVGNLVGAGLCGWLLQGGARIALCLAVAGSSVIVFAILARLWSETHYQTSRTDAAEPVAVSPVYRRFLYLLGAIAFLALFAEGALCDWIAIYLVDTIGTSESTGAFGFAVFAGMMALGRAFGDAANSRFGVGATLTFGAGAVALALSCALLATSVPVIFFALAVCGLGVANIVPVIFSVAGKSGGAAAGAAMSQVATMGYAGLLVGPPFIGFLAQLTSLTTSLFFVVVAMIVVAAARRAVEARSPRQGHV